MKFCPNCGFKLVGGEIFCPKCGFDLEKVESGAEQNQPNQTNDNNAEQHPVKQVVEGVSATSEQPAQPVQNPTTSVPSPNKGKIKSGWLIAVVGIIAIIALSWFFFVKPKPFGGSYTSQTTVGKIVKAHSTMVFKDGVMKEYLKKGELSETAKYIVSGNKVTISYKNGMVRTGAISNKNNTFVLKVASFEKKADIVRTPYERK